MRDAIEVVVKALVEDADAVEVREVEREGTTRIEVRVAQTDMGTGPHGARVAFAGLRCRRKATAAVCARRRRMMSAGCELASVCTAR